MYSRGFSRGMSKWVENNVVLRVVPMLFLGDSDVVQMYSTACSVVLGCSGGSSEVVLLEQPMYRISLEYPWKHRKNYRRITVESPPI